MPKGDPFTIPPPTKGYLPLANVLLPQDGSYLLDGKNVLIDRKDFSVTVRDGFYLFKSLSLGSGEEITGGFYFKDTSGKRFLIISTSAHWYCIELGVVGATPVDITDTSTPPTSKNRVSFDVFFQSGYLWVYGCNGVDGVFRWRYGLSTYQKVTGAPALFDACTFGNRVIGIDASTRTIRWSAVNDMTVWPQLAYYGMPDTEDIVAIRPIGRNIAIIFANPFFYSVQPQEGTDATAFYFAKLSSEVLPVSKNAIVNVGNFIFYLGIDKRFYRYDGVNINDVSLPVVMPYWKAGTREYVSVRYDRTRGLIWLYFPRDDYTECMVYDPYTGLWQCPQRYNFPIMSVIPFIDPVERTVWEDFGDMTWEQAGRIYTYWADVEKSQMSEKFVLCSTNNLYITEGSTDGDDDIDWYFVTSPVFIDHSSLVLLSSVEPLWARPILAPVSVYYGKLEYGGDNIKWAYLGSIFDQYFLLNNLDDVPSRYIFFKLSGAKSVRSKYIGTVAYVYRRKQMQN